MWQGILQLLETAQKHICRRPSHCLRFNGSNSNKQYNWLPIVLLLFQQTKTSGTRDSMKYIRRGEEGVRASDLGPSENQAILEWACVRHGAFIRGGCLMQSLHLGGGGGRLLDTRRLFESGRL